MQCIGQNAGLQHIIFHLSFLLVFASQGLAFERFSKVSLTLSLLSLAVSSIASVRRIQIQTHHVEDFVVGRMPQLVAYDDPEVRDPEN